MGDWTPPLSILQCRGAAWMGASYTCNLCILGGILELVKAPGAWAPVICGASHVYPLRQAAQKSDVVRVEDARAYLDWLRRAAFDLHCDHEILSPVRAAERGVHSNERGLEGAGKQR